MLFHLPFGFDISIKIKKNIKKIRIDDRIIDLFVNEIFKQCCFAEFAIEDYKKALNNGDYYRLWYSIQALLISTANISKIIWGRSRDCCDRKKKLAGKLNIDFCSSLKSRKFRNHFEHFDERLEEWAKTSRRQNYVDWITSPRSGITGLDLSDCFRWYISNENKIRFRGEEYDLTGVEQSIIELKNIIGGLK